MPPIIRNEKGTLDGFAFPGGYPIVYYTQDNGILCSACANQENGSDAHEKAEDPQWKLVSCDIEWEYEDFPPVCDHCGKEIETAYGKVG